jgi:hypothetical protein
MGVAGFVGLSAIDTSWAAVTSRPVDPLIDVAGSVAVIETVPTRSPFARPSAPAELLIVARVVSDEVQVTEVVRFWVVLSV